MTSRSRVRPAFVTTCGACNSGTPWMPFTLGLYEMLYILQGSLDDLASRPGVHPPPSGHFHFPSTPHLVVHVYEEPMHPTLSSAVLALALPGALAEPIPAKVRDIEPRQTIIPGGPACGEHGPDNRRCWMDNWTIDKENEIDPPPAFVSSPATRTGIDV